MTHTGPLAMGELLAHHAWQDPRRPMLTVGAETVTREGLEARANRRARQIAAFGVGADDLVTVAMPNGVEFYETTFALWKLGATPNIVSPKLPDAELGAIVQLVDPKVVIGPDASRLPGRNTLPAGTILDAGLSAEPLPRVVPTYWKAMTSGGSTGRPKVIVDHMPGLWDPAMASLGQIPGDNILNPGPLYHNAPFIGTHFGLFTGSHIVDMVKFDAEMTLALIERHRIGWVNFVPTMMSRISRLPPEVRDSFDLTSLRAVFHMGSACPIWLKQAWIDWLGADRIFELYSGTERQGATIITGREWLERKGSVGQLQPGARMKILNEAGHSCAPREIGEIYLLPETGRNATYHYIGADAKADGEWESLGDMGYVDEDGYLYLVDRRTDLIVSGGANIYPAEVEAALEVHPQIVSAVVIGLPDDDLGQRVHAIVQPVANASVTADELLTTVSEQLARYKVPRTLEFTDQPLRDEAGKIRRFALREERLGAVNTDKGSQSEQA